MIDVGEVSVRHDDTVTYAHVVAASGKVRMTLHHESPRGLSADTFEAPARAARDLAALYARAAEMAGEHDARQLSLFSA